MQHEHEERIVTIQPEASLKAFEAIAPGVKVNVFGNGGQVGQIMTNLMSLSPGIGVVPDEVPLVDDLLSRDGAGPNGGLSNAVADQLGQSGPYLR